MGKFVTKTGNDGQHYFNLKADNGQVILTSEGYTTVAAMNNGIASVRKNASDESHFDILTATNGKFYFTLKASNGQVIGKSQMYENESGRSQGIASVVKNAPSATEEKE